MVIKPVVNQTTISNPGLFTCRAMSADTMKIPEPIIEPVTIMVASSGPRLLTSPWSALGVETLAASFSSDMCGGLHGRVWNLYHNCPTNVGKFSFFFDRPSCAVKQPRMKNEKA